MNINEVIELNEDLLVIRDALVDLSNQAGKYHLAMNAVDLIHKHLDNTDKQIKDFDQWCDEQANFQGAIV